MAIRHKFTSSMPDIGGGTYIQPTHWNDQHSHPPFLAMSITPTSGVAVNAPSAYTNLPLGASQHGWFDFSQVQQVRLTALVAASIGFASCQVMVEFSANGVANWFPLATGATGPFVGIGSGALATGIFALKSGSWFAVNPSAVAAGSAGVFLRFRTFMGDGAADPMLQDLKLFTL